MRVLAWWGWNLTDIARELALIYLSTSIHLFFYIYIYIYIHIRAYYIYVYLLNLLFAWNQLQWPTLRTSLFPWSICLYLSIYLYTCVYLLFAWNQLQWPTLRTSLFWAFISLSLSNTYPSNGLSNNKTLNLAK